LSDVYILSRCFSKINRTIFVRCLHFE